MSGELGEEGGDGTSRSTHDTVRRCRAARYVHADRCAEEGGDHRDEVLSVGSGAGASRSIGARTRRPLSRLTMGADDPMLSRSSGGSGAHDRADDYVAGVVHADCTRE